MASTLDDILAATGSAKVIVTLDPGAAARDRAPRAAEADLQGHFVVPNEGQVESLAASARLTASRTFRRKEALTSRRVRVYPHLGLALGFVDREGLSGLKSDARVKKVVRAPELSLIRPVAARAARAPGEVTWGIRRIGADRLWAAGFRGAGVVVGHLDTGVDATHPALRGAIAAFAEFDRAGDRVPNAAPTDSDTHGTHTAGTIVGRPGRRGAFGVAPEARLASAMVIEGGQVIDRILAGMDWVVEEGVRIMSMSLGLRGFTPAFQTVIDALRNAGVLPVIAVGNEGPLSSRSPGNYANVLSVGAFDVTDAVADFSGSQRFVRGGDPLVPDLVGPGVAVLSCVPGGGFEEMDGSSMATPHLAGLAALLLQAKPDATAAELEAAILGSCRRPTRMPEARANRGVPDAALAFEILTGAPLPAAPPGGRTVAPIAGRAPAAGPKPDAKPRKGRPVKRAAAGRGKASSRPRAGAGRPRRRS